MKLYHKQLNSIEALKKEKAKLREAIKNDSFSSLPGLSSNKKDTSGSDSNDTLGAILDFLPMNVVQGMLVRLGLPLLTKIGKAGSKNAFAIGKEVFGGYVKWKALELTYRWIRRYANKRKEKSYKY